MKICMIGLGSIGTRHLKNLVSIADTRDISLQIDALRSSKNKLPQDAEDLLSAVYYSYDEMPDDYDVVFITNPTALHYETIERMISKTRHMFIEKPVFDKLDYNIDLLQWKRDCNYYVACPLRYHSVIKYVKGFAHKEQVYSVRSISSSYLPDWRPNTDYRESYSARSDLGGGVRGDLIHEWDYLTYLFGLPSEVYSLYGKFSHLDITSEDSAVYIAEYPDKLMSLHLDYFGRYDRRELELFTENEVVIGDLINNEIRFLRSGEIISLPQERNDIQREELECFIDMINGKAENHNNIAMAFDTLAVAMR